ncbi:MAG: endolytic transglycosylase MltG [Jatrophihabitantaceae bacterium]
MTQREREPLTDADPHVLLFGEDDEDGADRAADDAFGIRSAQRRASSHRHRRSRNRRLMLVMSVFVVLVLGVSAWLVVPRVLSVFNAPDYSGSGTGRVTIQVAQGDTAATIGTTLEHAGVVKSERAFADAAAANSASQNLQPGSYVLREHMSASSALNLMLDPSSRSTAGDVVVVEGATTFDVEAKLVHSFGVAHHAAVLQAVRDVAGLGIPLGYTTGSGTPRSVEGFLYPATYTLSPADTPSTALQKMTSNFAEHDRATGFAAGAKAIKITPYQALIIASIAQSEAKYPEDMAKVVRVILNRLAASRPLQIDATTRYGASLAGLRPGSVSYSTYNSSYNSYLHTGLPPTPISNPGAEAMYAAVHPPAGGWLYYVNADAQGHIFFTSDEAAFARAVAACKAHNWGCG